MKKTLMYVKYLYPVLYMTNMCVYSFDLIPPSVPLVPGTRTTCTRRDTVTFRARNVSCAQDSKAPE